MDETTADVKKNIRQYSTKLADLQVFEIFSHFLMK